MYHPRGFVDVAILAVTGLIFIGAGLFVLYSRDKQEIVLGAPISNFQRSILPETDSTYYLGTTTPSTNAWASLITDQVCLTADSCRTTWPTGGGGASAGNVATSTNETKGRVPYWTSTSGTPATLGEVSTTSITLLSPLSSSGTAGYLLGGTDLTIDVSTTTNSLFTGTAGQVLAYLDNGWTGVATTTFSGGLTYSAGNVTNTLTAGDGITRNTDDLDCDTASGSVFGCLSSADWTTFNNKLGSYNAWTQLTTNYSTTSSATTSPLWLRGNAYSLFASSTSQFDNATTTRFTNTGATWLTALTLGGLSVDNNGRISSGATTTAGTGLTYSGNAFNVNTSQNISTLSNLTTDGIVYTSGGAGTLNVDATPLDIARGGTNATSFSVTNGLAAYNGTSLVTPDSRFTLTSSLLTANAASTTALTAGSYFQIPSGTSFSNFTAASLSFDTTSGNLLMGTTTSATASVVIGSATSTLYAFKVGSTSPNLISGGTLNLPAHYLPQVATAIICDVTSGTSVVVNLSNEAGSSDTNTITCTTTSSQFQLSSNNTFAAYAVPRIEIGTVTGTVDYLDIRVIGYRTSD